MKSLINCSGFSSCVHSGMPEKNKLSLMLRDLIEYGFFHVLVFFNDRNELVCNGGYGLAEGIVFFSKSGELFLAEFQSLCVNFGILCEVLQLKQLLCLIQRVYC